MTYTAKSTRQFAMKSGTLSKKLYTEFSLIDAEIDLHKVKIAHLTIGLGTRTALATTGADVADGSGYTIYNVFVAPDDITLLSMYDIANEAYVKDTTDGKIELYDNATSPVKRFGRTLTAAGESAKAVHSTAVETGQSALAAGTPLNLKITATGSSSGTGHYDVMLLYQMAD
jgi:hypothetical protein